jgi:hypothetical protein
MKRLALDQKKLKKADNTRIATTIRTEVHKIASTDILMTRISSLPDSLKAYLDKLKASLSK